MTYLRLIYKRNRFLGIKKKKKIVKENDSKGTQVLSVSSVLENKDELPGNWGAPLRLYVPSRGRAHPSVKNQILIYIKIQELWQR